MKGIHITVTAVLLVLIMLLAGCGQSDQQEATPEETVGGWEMVSHEAVELPEDAQEAFDKVKESLEGGEYTPVSLMATQPVAGTNYCILCQITPDSPDAESKWALVYIYADLQGNAEVTNVYELYIAQHSTPKE